VLIVDSLLPLVVCISSEDLRMLRSKPGNREVTQSGSIAGIADSNPLLVSMAPKTSQTRQKRDGSQEQTRQPPKAREAGRSKSAPPPHRAPFLNSRDNRKAQLSSPANKHSQSSDFRESLRTGIFDRHFRTEALSGFRRSNKPMAWRTKFVWGLASECSLDDNYVYEAHCRQKMIALPV